MKLYYLFALILFTSSVVVAERQPLSKRLSLQPLTISERIQLPAFDAARLLKVSKPAISVNPKENIIRPLQISQTNIINRTIEQVGQWQSSNGESVWRLQIVAKDALHLNLGFKKMHLPESATLFISNARTGEVLKQYSAEDNKPHGQLWTPLLNTNELQIEINLSTSDIDKLSLELVQAGQGFKAVNPSRYSAKSDACNIDVVCPQGDGWRNEMRAVARYTISDGNGTFLCTGTLVNNTQHDLAPLFLTAAHCAISDISAPSMVFYWNYETSVCDGTPDGSLTQNQNGASLVSRAEGLQFDGVSDFALVRLDTMPDANFNVYYAGWDNRDQPYTGVRAIHHPAGDEKRISVDNDLLTLTEYAGTIEIPTSSFLRVGAWDEGTTEGGSSGSGLWSMDHHLIGTLSGGAASCADPTASDWYGRLAKHWLGNNFKSNQLAAHLDPDASGVATLAGEDNCSSPLVTISVSTNTPAVAEQISFTSMVTGGTGGNTYAWDFDGNGSTDSTDPNPIHTYNAASNNKVKLVVRDSAQCPGVDTSQVLAADNTEIFLANGLLPDGFVKTESAEGSWIVDDSRASEGLFSLKSQIINTNDSSSIELSGSFAAGTISFDRRVSSEDTFDFFKFYIDDEEQFSIAGEQDWANVSFPVAAGNHSFRWSFDKDAGLSEGEDAGWIDNLRLPNIGTNNQPVVVTPISNQTDAQGDTVNLDIAANFSDPDANPLSFSMANGPESLNIDSNTGVITGTLKASDKAGSPFTVDITASDGALEITDTFTWTVNAPPAPPPPPPPAGGGSSGGGGGSLGFSLFGLLLLSSRFRKRA